MRKSARLITALAVIFASLVLASCGKDEPAQSIAAINTGDSAISVTFQAMKADSSYEEDYLLDLDVAPGEFKHSRIKEGSYLVSAWDSGGNLIRKLEGFKVKIADEASRTNPIFIDAYGKSGWAIVNVNCLYEGKTSLAEGLAEAVGTAQDKLVVEKIMKGAEPFTIDESIYDLNLVFPGSKLPKEVKYGETVRALFSFTDEELAGSSFEELIEKKVAALEVG